MNYEIRSYSYYDNWTVTTNSKNVSDIMSKMVERAGRICERYDNGRESPVAGNHDSRTDGEK